MARTGADDVERMRREVERALGDRKAGDRADAARLLPMLARLARLAPARSDAWVFAHRHLAELGVERDPWRASLFARRVLDLEPRDDGAWAVLGLAQSLLGHHRFAARAYERALDIAPHNPWYAHNLGHLYDVALDRPEDALPLLARATDADTGETEIAASFAHALARCGKLVQAKRVLKRAIRHGATAEQASLWRWLESGAPPRAPAPVGIPAEGHAPEGRRTSRRTTPLVDAETTRVSTKKPRDTTKKPRRRVSKRTGSIDKSERVDKAERVDKPERTDKKARREPGTGR